MNNQLRDRYLTDPFIAQALDAYASGLVSYTEALETAVVALAEARERLESQYRELLLRQGGGAK